MMRHLLSVCAGLSLLLFSAVAVSRSIGHTLPVSPGVRWWHLTDCKLPCWGGFSIGTTPQKDVESRLRRLFLSPDYTVERDWWLGGNNFMVNVKHLLDNNLLERGSVSFCFVPNNITGEGSLSGETLPSLG